MISSSRGIEVGWGFRHAFSSSCGGGICGCRLFYPFLILPAAANILIEIDKSAQRMTVSQDGAQLYAWPVSTGQRGYDTPSGDFKPFRMEKDHFSREWDDAPMPHSIFFTTARPRHPRHRAHPQHRPAGVARLRAARAGERPRAVRPGQAGGHGQCPRRAVRRDAERRRRRHGAPRAGVDDDVTGSVPPRRVGRVRLSGQSVGSLRPPLPGATAATAVLRPGSYGWN